MSLSQKGGPTRTCFAGTLISDSPRLLNYENTCLLSGAFCYSNQWLLRQVAQLRKGGSHLASKSPIFINCFWLPITKHCYLWLQAWLRLASRSGLSGVSFLVPLSSLVPFFRGRGSFQVQVKVPVVVRSLDSGGKSILLSQELKGK